MAPLWISMGLLLAWSEFFYSNLIGDFEVLKVGKLGWHKLRLLTCKMEDLSTGDGLVERILGMNFFRFRSVESRVVVFLG